MIWGAEVGTEPSSQTPHCQAALISLQGLQLIENAATPVLTRTSLRDHISHILDFSAGSLWNTVTIILQELIITRFTPRSLFSRDTVLLVVPGVSNSSKTGARAPLLWKNLPVSFREADTLSMCKSRLLSSPALYSLCHDLTFVVNWCHKNSKLFHTLIEPRLTQRAQSSDSLWVSQPKCQKGTDEDWMCVCVCS